MELITRNNFNKPTLIQITNDEKVTLLNKVKSKNPSNSSYIPKMLFRRYEPSKGKIHRSWFVRFISVGIPTDAATAGNNNIS